MKIALDKLSLLDAGDNLITTATEALTALERIKNPDRVAAISRFFQTGPGQYAEGDQFWGIYVPDVRIVVKRALTLPLSEIEKLISHTIHEVRLFGLLVLVGQFGKARKSPETQTTIVDFYLTHRAHVNNWDLVDQTAYQILGAYLHTATPPATRTAKTVETLSYLLKSESLWDRRIAIVANLFAIRKGEFAAALVLIEMGQNDKHPLMHKAMGWMLREIGEKDLAILHQYLKKHAHVMPRTMLRYAIEKLSPEERQGYMAQKAPV